MAGRPVSLTDEVIKRICDELRQGGTKAAAAAASGYSLSAFMQWQAAGRKEIESIADGNPANRNKVQMVKFVEAMADAELVGEAELIRVIRRASEDHWQAAAWILERRHPEKYGRRMDLTSKDDKLDTRVVVTVIQESGAEPPDVFPADLGA